MLLQNHNALLVEFFVDLDAFFHNIKSKGANKRECLKQSQWLRRSKILFSIESWPEESRFKIIDIFTSNAIDSWVTGVNDVVGFVNDLR